MVQAMKDNFPKSLASVLVHEGGYVFNQKDPGGETNLGCTKAVWEEHCGHPVDTKTMKALTPADVGPLYKTKYWDKIKGDDLPAGVDYVVFDAAINSGPGRATKWLQACVGVEPDGGIGPKTLAAVRAMDAKQLIDDYSKRRLSFLSDLTTWETFGRGWARRVNEVNAVGLGMA
jgi:lysozyme family protein